MIDLDKLREAADNATPGPWENNPDTAAGRVWVRSSGLRGLLMICEPIFNVRAHGGKRDEERKQRAQDAAFVAAADPTTILALLDRMEAAEARVEDLSTKLGKQGERGIAVALRLAAAEKLIEAQRDALSTAENCGEDHCEGCRKIDKALAAYDAYRKEHGDE